MSAGVVVYSFQQTERKGFGARLFDICNALAYCKTKNLTLKFVENENIPFFAKRWSDVMDYTQWKTVLTRPPSENDDKKINVATNQHMNHDSDSDNDNGTIESFKNKLSAAQKKRHKNKQRLLNKIEKLKSEMKELKSHGTPFQSETKELESHATQSQIKSSSIEKCAEWQKCFNLFGGFEGTKTSMELYHQYASQLFKLNPVIQQKVDELVKQSGFKNSDIVVHLRMTDKVKQVANGSTLAESAEQDLQWYWDEVNKFIKTNHKTDPKTKEVSRIFICSDSPNAFEQIPTLSDNVHITWDKNEHRSVDGYCPSAFREGKNKEQQEEELLTCLKNLTIMKHCRFLVGARCSYFFRIGELLHYPKPSVNVKDSDMFGRAEYADPSSPIVRPCKVKAYLNFVNKSLSSSQSTMSLLKSEMKQKGMVTIRNIIRPDLAESIYKYLHNEMPEDWWVTAIKHQRSNEVFNFHKHQNTEMMKQLEFAKQDHDRNLFCYCFKRTIGIHYTTCGCAVCRVVDSVCSYEFLDFISEVVGEKLSGVNETFASKYENGDWLSIHHDKKKGKYAFVFSFNKDWNPCHGGLLHFVEHAGKPDVNIYNTVIPSFNSLQIFRIVEGRNTDHFVSSVTGNGKRISITGWLV